MRNLYYLIICFLSFSVLSAQEKLSKEEKARREKNIQAGNPFAKYGSKAPVATLSKGKYLEVHDLDSIVTIGTSRWDVDNRKIVGDIKIDSLNVDSQPIGDAPGRWMSPDPLSEEYRKWSPYTFCVNNPMRFTDPDGMSVEDIIVSNKADRAQVLKMINSQAKGTFGINDKTGKLYVIKKEGSSKMSGYYSDKLIAGINSKDKINISIGDSYFNPDTNKLENVDSDAGGGVTIQKENSKDGTKNIDVIISGNPETTSTDTEGKPLVDDAKKILAHELVGHAIPAIIGKDTGNAVENENKVRKDLKEPMRSAEPDHNE